MSTQEKPIFVFVPGAALTPLHYGYLSHLLLSAGYGCISATLPNSGTLNGIKVNVDEDVAFVRDRMILPLLETEQRDVIVVGHSYSGIPASAAVAGLAKSERVKQGKGNGVLGQIHVAALIPRGGDGTSLLGAFGGEQPPHQRADIERNLVRCDDPIPPLMQDLDPVLARAAARSTICPNLSVFDTPVPRASWDTEAYKGRIAYIKTLSDHAVPTHIQQMLLDASGQEWMVREIDTGHLPMLGKPVELSKIFLEIAEKFENM